MRTTTRLGAGCALTGLSALLIGCDGVMPCGNAVGMDCPEGSFCAVPPGFCDSPVGVCTPIPEACTEELDPVCGCDGETYSNACLASAAAVNIASEGECGEDGAPPGATCGGLAGIACAEGSFCLFQLGSCGSGDQTGACMDTPEVCTDEFDPVCGCDGETYGNECMAWAAGVSVASEGECE